MQEGLLLNCTASKVLRFAPPLTITKREIDRASAYIGKSSRAPVSRRRAFVT